MRGGFGFEGEEEEEEDEEDLREGLYVRRWRMAIRREIALITNMEHGIWNMEYGIWNMEHGIRNMQHGDNEQTINYSYSYLYHYFYYYRYDHEWTWHLFRIVGRSGEWHGVVLSTYLSTH